MPEVGKVTTTRASCEPAEQSKEGCYRKIPNDPHPISTVDGVEDQAQSLEDDNTVKETRDEKKARFLRELEELTKEEEEIKREEELRDLERQVEVARKRIREREVEPVRRKAQVASQGQEEWLQSSATAGNASTAHTHSGSGLDNPISPITQTAAGHSPGYNGQTLPRDSVASASSSEVLASSSHRHMTGTASNNCVRTETLKYYKELDGDGVGGSVSLKDMDLNQLRRLAANEEGAAWNIEQTKSIGRVYYSIFLKTGALEDLQRAIDQANEQVPFNVDNPHYVARLKDLIVMLVKKYQHSNALDDLQEALFRAQEMMAATPLDHPDRSARMGDWIDMMFMKFRHTGSQDDLDEATITAREVGAAVSVDNSEGGGPIRLEAGIPIPSRALIQDPNRAVKFAETTTAMTTHDIAGMELFDIATEMTFLLRDMSEGDLRSFAELHEDPTNNDQIELYIYTCFLIFTRTDSTEYLEQAIQRTESWIAELAIDHPDRARRFRILDMMSAWMSQLSFILEDVELMLSRNRRFERTGSMDDLNRAVDVADMAVNAIPQDHPYRADYLNNLGNQLDNRFERTGSINDLNRAIDVADMALGRRFKQTGSMDDLNRAIDVTDMAINATPQDHPNRARWLSNFGTLLGNRFERTGSIDDLNRAVNVMDIAVNATPQNHPDRAGQLNNLGTQLGRRFEQTGSMDDLNRAVDVADMAINAVPQDHLSRATYLNNLGNYLGNRFEQTGSIDDLNRAVNVTDMAVNAIFQNYPVRAAILNNLGNQLGKRFELTGSMDDLNRAVNVTDMAVNATPQNQPDRSCRLSNLGNWLINRFDRTGSMDDLNRAVDVANMAINAAPQNHPNRVNYLNNLGNSFSRRFHRTGSMDDLNRAVDLADMAVNAIPQDHPGRAICLNNLGTWLCRRFERTGSMDDFNRALTSYKKGWRCHTAPPSMRIRLAQLAASILTEQANWEESSLLLQEAVNLLPIISPRSLKHTDKQHMLADFAGLASMAAATALNSGKEAYHALQLLELGRGVIAGLLMEMRRDISDLQQQHPNLANEFTSLRNELDAPADRTSPIFTNDILSWELQANRRREADQNFNELITRIRTQPGFHNFLLPPTADEFMAAADPDPIIVVNLSSYRCDAFLITHDRIRRHSALRTPSPMAIGLVFGGFLLDFSAGYHFMQPDAMLWDPLRQSWTESCHRTPRQSRH
ncbi:hypothetical protein DL767_001798 [Monosporascus sp. MG133]|nr:hypothetical protein DL767_001798 [Monosporascus sp. MG133]